MDDALQVAVVDTRGRLVVTALTGVLDMATVGEGYARVTALLSDHPDLIVDLSGVTFCDSSGFNGLLRLRRRVLEAGGWLALVDPPPQIGRLLVLTGGDAVFVVHRGIDEAIKEHQDLAGH